jgi:transposase
MGALITYLNVEHALPYERLSQITHDLLGFAISEGTVANKLARMHISAKGLIERIKHLVMDAPWIGSDETGTSVAGKTFWEWVWQSPLASYFVIDKRRGYGVVKEHFTERYKGVICHDCWCAQNKTPAGAHQLCHAHLLRNLQYAVDAERSVWAYRMQQLLRKSQRAREQMVGLH